MRLQSFGFQHHKVDFGNQNNNIIPAPSRQNLLHDEVTFSIIADKIRSQSLKNQMNTKLSQLKKNIDKFISQDNT